MSSSTPDQNNRKYIEVAYTFEKDEANILVGLYREDPNDHVTMFACEGGILACVSHESSTYARFSYATDVAIDLSQELLGDLFSGDVPAPWKVTVVDLDGASENLQSEGWVTDSPPEISQAERDEDSDTLIRGTE